MSVKALMSRIQRYQEPSTALSIWQVVTSILPFVITIYLAWLTISLGWSYYFVSLPVIFLGAMFLVRVFMIQHDCGHGSLFRSRQANDAVGIACSLLTFIPYYYWRRQHAIHHASNGNLSERGHGDVDLLTVKEYLARDWFGRLRYRVYRHPFGYLLFGPIFFFLLTNRFVFDRKKTNQRERSNVYWTNGFLLLLSIAAGSTLGWAVFLKIIAPLMYFAGAIGIWIFYIQHQFEHTYWKAEGDWQYFAAAMHGSSYYKLPAVLQWFTSNIGFHHIHHLKPSIPNYRLEECHNEFPELQNVPTLTLMSSLKTMFLCLWDEDAERLISFREFKQRYG